MDPLPLQFLAIISLRRHTDRGCLLRRPFLANTRTTHRRTTAGNRAGPVGWLGNSICGDCRSWATTVALDYTDASEVQEFIDKTGVTLPVLMGNPGTASDWSVRAFPTYYVIDAEGRISSRSVGYSTGFGMLIRNWLALDRE